MRYKFVYRPFVKQDLQNAINYYRAISSNLAKDFLYRIREAKKYIAINPKGDDVMYQDIRMHNLINFHIIFTTTLIMRINKLLFLQLNFLKETT